VLVPHPAGPAPVWYEAVAPTADERAVLRGLGVPDELVDHALDTHELARIDHHRSGARMFVLRVPAHVSPDAPVVPLGVVTTPKGALVTLSLVDTRLPTATALREDGRDATRFSLALAFEVAVRFDEVLSAVDLRLADLERRLRGALENDEILGMLDQQRHLVHYATALEVDRLVLERAIDDTRLGLSAADRALATDVLVELRQAEVMARTRKELVGETMDALATVVSNNLNVAMKQLASLTLLVSIPSLVAGVYGMNVTIPAQGHPGVFWALAGASALVVTAAAAVLRWRRWL
jgi:magnesium transporter